MATPKNGVSSADRTLKRFTNGHKTFGQQEARFYSEIMRNEKKASAKFLDDIPILRKPRDPTVGEETPRRDFPTTDLYFPEPPAFMRATDTVKAVEKQIKEKDQLRDEFTTNLQLADSLSRQKAKLEEELRIVNQVLQHKKLVLSMSSGTMGKLNASNTFPTTLPK